MSRCRFVRKRYFFIEPGSNPRFFVARHKEALPVLLAGRLALLAGWLMTRRAAPMWAIHLHRAGCVVYVPPMQPRRRPAWQGVAWRVAGLLGLSLVRGAFGFGRALAKPEVGIRNKEVGEASPCTWIEPTNKRKPNPESLIPNPSPERPTAPVERLTPPTPAPQPPPTSTRPAAQRSEAVEVAATPTPVEAPQPTPEPARERRRATRSPDYQQRDMRGHGQPATNVWWGDSKLNPPAGSVLRPDLSQKNLAPAVETSDGRVIYPNHWGSYKQSVSRDEYLANSCEIDPILFGVNVEQGIADLFYLGAWAYQ